MSKTDKFLGDAFSGMIVLAILLLAIAYRDSLADIAATLVGAVLLLVVCAALGAVLRKLGELLS